MVIQTDILIIGSGPAGLTAAIYNGRANLKPVVLAGRTFGGQLMNTTIVENYPGYPEGIAGPALMQNMIKQAEKWGATMVYKNAEKVDFSGPIKKVWAEGEEYHAKAVIVTVGAAPRILNIPGEQKFWGKGVSTCATCDGALYKNKVVAVIGGGDTAMEEAIFLSRHASKVYIIHRRDEFKASDIMQKRAMSDKKIEVIWNTEIQEVVGDTIVKSLKHINNKTNEVAELAVDGMFLAIGNDPNSTFLKNSLKLNARGYVDTKNVPFTEVEGVFVAGEIVDYEYKQAITSAGDGCKAALAAEKWLDMQEVGS